MFQHISERRNAAVVTDTTISPLAELENETYNIEFHQYTLTWVSSVHLSSLHPIHPFFCFDHQISVPNPYLTYSRYE
jgi:hypothetical protein